MNAWTGNGYTPEPETVQTGPARLPEHWTIRLLYPKPPYGLSMNDRPHWAVKGKATKAVRTDVMYKVRQAKVPALERIRVDVTWMVTTRHHRDADNLAPFLKAIYDGIGSNRGISARIVEDDTPDLMQKPEATIEHLPGGEPHFVVRITDLGSAS
jgi:hypothetical protein